MPGSEQHGAVLGKKKPKEILQDRQLPYVTQKKKRKKVVDQCVIPTMTYDCQTWSLNRTTDTQLKTAQRAMERKMLQDKVPCSENRKRTKMIDIIYYTLKQK